MNLKKYGTEAKDGMMTGMGYMIPVVVGGAIIMAMGNLLAGQLDPKTLEGTLSYDLYTWGDRLFGCMNLIFAMYTAYRIGNRPALAPGLFAGIFAVNSPAGFLGALFGGLVAGWLVRFLNDKIKLSGNLQSVKGLLILPLSSCLGIFIIMNYILVPLCTWIMNVSISILTSAKDISPFLFGGILSGITAIGMGSIPGRVCFAVAMMIVDQTGSYMPFTAMTCGGSCVCLGIAIAMLVAKNKFTVQERAGIVGLIVGWLCIITEMCIPYALKDPKRVFPAMFLGGFIGGGLVYVLNVEVPVMHGGMFVAPLANNFGLWAVCILATAIVTAAALIILKPNLPLEETTVDNNLNN